MRVGLSFRVSASLVLAAAVPACAPVEGGESRSGAEPHGAEQPSRADEALSGVIDGARELWIRHRDDAARILRERLAAHDEELRALERRARELGGGAVLDELEALRVRLADREGPAWRKLEELAGSSEATWDRLRAEAETELERLSGLVERLRELTGSEPAPGVGAAPPIPVPTDG